MRLEQTHRFLLRHNPCCLDIFRDGVIVGGTYELQEDCLDERKNKRLGSLFIFKDCQVELEYECLDGGVFDLKCYKDIIVTAHSNGRVGVYEVSLESLDIKQRHSFDTNCNLLSCIDVDQVIGVGSNCGKIVLLSWEGNVIDTILENSNQDPVWSVSLCPFDECNPNNLIFSGSESGSLQVFFKGHSLVNEKSASAGVTCVRHFKVNIEDQGKESKKKTLSMKIVSGSYDENIRIYNFSFCQETLKAILSLKHVLNIAGSGVWRIRPSFKDTNLVSGMYSGVHVIDLLLETGEKPEVVSSLSWSNTDKKSSPEDNELIYDVAAVSSDDDPGKPSNILVASFYRKGLYLLNCHEK